jgi:two-component system, LytTR family, response regulator
MTIRAVVADDQPLARERLLTLLAAEPDVTVVATADSGRHAVDAIRAHAPDLVFLDMQMPELDGLGVIEEVGVERMPATIFVTAFDDYAVQAFEVHALDYLLKPFGRQRFQQALSRARLHLQRSRSEAVANQLVSLVQELRRPAPEFPRDRVIVRAGGRVTFLDTDQIDWVEAEGNYVRLHTGDGLSYLMRETMTALLSRLSGDRFFRIHRSRIVRLACIKELRLAAGGDYDVILRSGIRLGLSRLYKDGLQHRLAGL